MVFINVAKQNENERDLAALARDEIQKPSSLAVSMELQFRVSKTEREMNGH